MGEEEGGIYEKNKKEKNKKEESGVGGITGTGAGMTGI